MCTHPGTLKILSVWGNVAKSLSLWRTFSISIGRGFHNVQDQEEGIEEVHQPAMTSKALRAKAWFWMSHQQTPTETCAPSQLPTKPASASASHVHHGGGYFHKPGLNHIKEPLGQCWEGLQIRHCSSLRGGEDTAGQTSQDLLPEGQQMCRARHCLRPHIHTTYSHGHTETSESYTHIQHTSSAWPGSLWMQTQPDAHIFNRHTAGPYVCTCTGPLTI